MPNPRDVFVIHGRDDQARKAIWRWLQSIDLHPIDWEEMVRGTDSAAPFLGQLLQDAFADVQAALVLLTPDDGAFLHESLRGEDDPEHETRTTGQARPNVLFEAGMALALHPTRTVLVQIGRVRPFSDIGGRAVVKFDGSATSLQKIVNRLQVAGCAVNTRGTDWLDPDRFADLAAYTRRFS